METSIMSLLESGRLKLAEREEKRRADALKKAMEDELRLTNFLEKLHEGLEELLPAGMADYIDASDYRTPAWGNRTLRLAVPGCAPISIELWVTETGIPYLQGDNPYTVPGVRSRLPYFDLEYGYLNGEVEYIFHTGRYDGTDEHMGVEMTGDLELALALAEERQRYYEQQQAYISEQQQAHSEATRNFEAAGEKTQEPVYEPVENDQADELINKPELVRFIRGVVSEELEARGL